MNSSGIRLFKKSGQPVDPEDLQKYMEDWRATYDLAEEKAKKDISVLNRMLRYAEYALYKKYYKDVYINDFNHLKEIIVEQNYMPITFGVTEGGELVAVIQDI